MATLGLLAGLWLGAQPDAAEAAPQKLAEFNEKGSFILVGNTVGWDCASGLPAPTVGTAPMSSDCGANIDDSSADVLWQTDGQTASADMATTPLRAGSTSVLNLPAGAIVVHARLFWAAQLPSGATAGRQVTLDRPGRFSQVVLNDPAFPGLTQENNGRSYYQGHADITRLVQQYGPGVYRVTGIPTTSLAGVLENVAFVNWHMAVVYRKADEPTRNIVIYRGLDLVQPGSVATANLDGFLVPNTGFSGQLGIVGYEGDDSLVGDSFSFNGVVQSNPLNPATNFFNSTRTNVGQPVSVQGDLPQMSGMPSSMVGLDLDVVDVTAQLASGQTSGQVRASSSGDLYFLGGFATAISTLFPVFSDSTKTYVNVSRPDKPVIPGDTIRYTLKILNNGSDTSINTELRDALPPQISYVPGSLRIVDGANAGAKTDASGDDQFEYEPQTRTLKLRLGMGATSAAGGTVAVGETTTIEFLAVVSRAISGRLDNQGAIAGQGQRAVAQGVSRPGSWLTGDGTAPSVPTSIFVDCQSDLQCGPLAPKCERSLSPPRCACSASADCPSGFVCDPVGRSCVQCTASPAQTQSCQAAGQGAVCLPDNRCGCNSDADCGAGRVCDLGSRTCPSPKSDLDVRVIPPATPAPPGMSAVYSVQITNLGPDPATNASIITQLPPGITGATWTCSASGATCPAAMGEGPLPGTVTLPPGGVLIYTLTLPVPASYSSETVPIRVTALPANGTTDPQPGNNTGFGDAIITRDSRPDLFLELESGVGPEAYSTLYTVTAKNRGPAPAPGALFTYMAPPDATIINVTPGDGWTCTTSDDKRYLSCETSQEIPASGSAPPVQFQVRSPSGSKSQLFTGTVSPRDPNGFTLTDAMPEDNTLVKDVPFGDVKLAGGGFGCAMGAETATGIAPFGALLGFLLTTAALGRRRRRR